MKKHLWKRSLSILFATALVVQSLPMTSLAEGTVTDTVTESVDTVNENTQSADNTTAGTEAVNEEAQAELNSSAEELGYEPGEILIVYDDSVSDQDVSQTVEDKEGTVVDTTEVDTDTTVATVSIDENTTVREAVDTYQEDASIKYAFPNYVMELQATNTDDTDIANQYYLDTVNASGAWNLMSSGTYEKTKVAVLDTGADIQNPDLANVINMDESKEVVKTEDAFSMNPLQGDDYVNGVAPADDQIVSHGTAIAGIIAGQANNATGIAGVASGGNNENPYIDLVVVDVFSGVRTTNADYLLKGLEYADSIGAKVINLSLGLNASILDTSFNEYLQSIFSSLEQKGITVVCAAGNESTDDCGTVQTVPSDYDSTISVAAVDENNQLADYSNYGSKKDVVAPGTNIYSTYNSVTGTSYETISGTSMACSIVTAEAALLLSVNPNLSTRDIKNDIRETATDLGDEGFDNTYAAGLVNLEAAVQRTMSDEGVNSGEVSQDNVEQVEITEDITDTVESSEDEIEANQDSTEDGPTEEVSTEENEEPAEVANSWRFKNGERIQVPDFNAFAVANAWTKVNGNYINSAGAIIPGVVCRGVDVSHWNGTIDWQAAKNDDISYAIIAAGWYSSSRNAFIEDSQFQRNVSECERLGIPYGVYTYSYALNTAQAKVEAQGILNLIRGHNLSYPVYYDMEDSSQQGLGSKTLGDLAATFCDAVKNSGYNVGIYANTNWFTNILTDSRFNNWSKWVAQYNTTCNYKGDYTMWQCSSTVSIKGIGTVDLNMDFGTTKYATGVEEGTYTFASALNNNKVATLSGDNLSDGTNVILSTNTSSALQRMEVRSVGSGYYSITLEKTGKVLSVKGNSSSAGTVLEQRDWNNEQGQKWIFHNIGNGYYYIESALGTYIDVSNGNSSDGTRLDGFTLNHTDSQKWKISLSNDRPFEDGTYNIISKNNASLELDIDNSSMANCANVQAYLKNNTSAQRFELEYQSNGYYKITAEHSGKALDIVNGDAGNNINVQQYTWNGTSAQLWKFVKSNDGSYFLKSKLGKVLTIGNGNNVVTQNINNTNYQMWTLSVSAYKPIENGIYHLYADSSKQKAVDIAGASFNNGANVQVYSENGSSAQRFEITYYKDGYYKIINEQSGLSLDVFGGSKNSGANIQQYAWNGTNSQLWKFVDGGNGRYYIKSRLGTVMSANASAGANVATNTLESKENNYWTIQEDSEQLVKDGVYSLQTKLNSQKVLDIANASTSNGANVQIFSGNGSRAQNCKIEYQNNGYYRVSLNDSEKVLDVSGGKSTNGTNVQQYAWNGSDSQLWKMLAQDDGSYVLKSKLGKVLDISNGSSRDGANVQIYSFNNSVAQKWYLASQLNEKTVSFYSCLDTSKVMDVSGGSVKSGANIQLFTGNNTTAQKFSIKNCGNGYYSIISLNSAKALDIAGGSSKNGANIQQYSANGSEAQQWKFLYAGNNRYIIQSRLGTVIDVCNGNSANGTNIQTYTLNNSIAQKWQIK